MMCVYVAFEGVFCKCCNTHSLSIGFSEFLINQMSLVEATLAPCRELGIVSPKSWNHIKMQLEGT